MKTRFNLWIAAVCMMMLASCAKAPEKRILGTWNIVQICNTWSGECTTLPTEDHPDVTQSVEFLANGTYKFSKTSNGVTTPLKTGSWTLFDDAMLDLTDAGYPNCTMGYTIEQFTNDRLVITITSINGSGCGWYDKVYLEK